jgi:hypothetical protein
MKLSANMQSQSAQVKHLNPVRDCQEKLMPSWKVLAKQHGHTPCEVCDLAEKSLSVARPVVPIPQLI